MNPPVAEHLFHRCQLIGYMMGCRAVFAHRQAGSDNYNDDTDDGIHLTSMAGTWSPLSRACRCDGKAGYLTFKPYLPDQWQGIPSNSPSAGAAGSGCCW